ncbi:helix-turn-helix domain-containing protein [Vallitalea okinawensis]|uniref:helix-turn-helix domain-containing protein n=1 Tax=Vallitalea okinawensis TaxID=2078660 RepID=UPI000CFCB883|nr:helix-turn-helix transcriptional regulator [Vallitalea okinawensis]
MIGEQLKHLRMEHKKTQQEVADLLGIRCKAYAQYESNELQLSFNQLVEVADLYHVTMDYLLDRTHIKYSDDPYDEKLLILYQQLKERPLLNKLLDIALIATDDELTEAYNQIKFKKLG